jgi:hypothetical protein
MIDSRIQEHFAIATSLRPAAIEAFMPAAMQTAPENARPRVRREN